MAMGLRNNIAWLVILPAPQFATMQAPVFAFVLSRCIILYDPTDFSATVHIQHASSLLAHRAQKVQIVALQM